MFKTLTLVPASLLAAGLLTVSTAYAEIDKTELKAEKDRIEATYKNDKDRCGQLKGNAKDVCLEEAKAKEKVAKAELEYKRTGKDKDAKNLAETKAKTQYAVAKEKCDDLNGNAKDVCVKEAKAAETKALSDVKLTSHVQDAKKDNAEDKRDADYKVATEKCDALSGDAKNNCQAEAKARFGK